MKIILLASMIILFSSGCATLVKDCKQQGDSQYYHCKKVWYPK